MFYEGGTPEQRQLYDYAMALNKKYATQYKPNSTKLTYDADKVQYYKNIFNEMTTKGYTTYDDMIKDKYINTEAESETTPFASNEWLVRYVKQGKFVISFYSKNDESFIKTTLDDDESIVNKELKQKIKDLIWSLQNLNQNTRHLLPNMILLQKLYQRMLKNLLEFSTHKVFYSRNDILYFSPLPLNLEAVFLFLT